jgi:hypothetical protein
MVYEVEYSVEYSIQYTDVEYSKGRVQCRV